MPGNKYLKVGTAGLAEEVASNDTTAGAGDAGKIVALDAAGLIALTMMPVGVGADTITATAFENLTAGDYVYIRSDGQVAKAVATAASTLAMGFVLSSVTATGTATVYMDQKNTAVSGLTAGTRYFLSPSVAGAVTATVPTTAGQYVQSLGRATSATVLATEIGEGMLRA